MAKTELEQLQDEIKDLLKKLPDKGFKVIDVKSVGEAKVLISGLRSELREMSGDLDYIAKSFQDSVDELSKQNTYLQTAKSSLTGISDISRKLVDFRRGENNLTDKQLSTLKDQARVKFEQLKIAIDSGKLGDAEQFEAEESLKLRENFNKALDRTLEIQAKVNKQVGLLGQGLEGAGKFLEKMGFAGISKPISDAIQKTKEARRQILYNNDAIAEGGKAYKKNGRELAALDRITGGLSKQEKARKAYLESQNKLLKDNEKILEDENKELATQTSKYKNILNALKEQLTSTNLIDASITKIVDSYFEVNKAAVEYQRLSGVNATNQAALNSRFADSVDYLETIAELTKQTGIAAGSIFSNDDIAAMAEAKNLLGLTAEQAGKLGINSKVSGVSIDNYKEGIVKSVNSYNGLNRTTLAHGLILQDVLSVSEDISMSLGGDADKITQAATAARSLGLSLERVNQIADQMLNFEDSISAELEAELMTGKQLNLEKAREYALTNNIAGLAEELKKNGVSAAEYARMGRLEQESMAKALGMSREELGKMTQQQLLQEGASKEAQAAARGMTVEQLEAVSVQERLATLFNKLGQAFAPIFEVAIPLVEALGAVLQPIAKMIGYMATGLSPFIKYLVVGFGILKGMQITLGAIAGIQTAITVSKASELGLGLSLLANLGLRNAAEMYKLTLMTGGTTQAAIQAGLQETILASVIAQGASMLRNLGHSLRQLGIQIGIAAAYAVANPFTALVGLAVAAGVGALVYSQMKDGIIDPKEGPVLSGEFGSVQLDPKDKAMYGADGTIKVGTDLVQNKPQTQSNLIGSTSNNKPQTISQAVASNDNTSSEIKQMRQENKQLLTALLQKTGDVYMDSNKVGRSQVLGSYKSS